MKKIAAFNEFLVNSNSTIPAIPFAIDLILAFVLALLLGITYKRYGTSISNRTAFARNFVLISMTTMLIITIVKSSLALSLGLVGALSIIRFRTALKEPEELSYTFLSIAVGLGLGASQRTITLIGFSIIIGVLILRHYTSQVEHNEQLILITSAQKRKENDVDLIVQTVQAHCDGASLKRLSESKTQLEMAFNVTLKDVSKLQQLSKEIQEKNPDIAINVVDCATSTAA
ncbi:MAG: DUF4956 domain-containing protein [bacterium]|nr:DUF4956 domain-containing protein [bacterium]